MNDNDIFCLACKSHKNETVFMVEINGYRICPECNNSYPIDGTITLESYKSDWNENADKTFFLLRPELNPIDLANPKLFSLYMDCYQTLLSGRYNASIVMMGLLLEAIIKNIYFLKFGTECTKPFGPCLQEIQKHKLMNKDEIKYLNNFKNEIRNPYQHVDDGYILKNVKIPVWPIKFEKPEELISQIEKMKAGDTKPTMMSASEEPAIQPIIKNEYDSKKAIVLFNTVYDFLVLCNNKYFNQREWDKHHQKYSTDN